MIGSLAFIFTVLLVNTIMFTWIYDLERSACTCSKSWKREALKYSIPVTVALAVIAVVIQNVSWSLGVYSLYNIASTFVLICMLSYVLDLRRLSCKCSKGWRETFSYVWPITVAVIWLINVLIVLGVIIYSSMKKTQNCICFEEDEYDFHNFNGAQSGYYMLR